MVHDIYIIDNKNELKDKLKENFKREVDEYKFKTVKTSELEVALRNIPTLLIIDEDNTDINIVEFCKSIRTNEDNSITPIIVISSNREKEHAVEVLKTDVQYYIKKPLDDEFFYYTIKNIVGLLTKNRTVSPLTGLPGNVQIQTEMKKRLLNKETFAILYFDLDNFKAYNDVYGFANGDEIIKFTSRVISKNNSIINVTGNVLEDTFNNVYTEDIKAGFADLDKEKAVEIAKEKAVVLKNRVRQYFQSGNKHSMKIKLF